ncbi:ATP-binding protein [Herbidospora mongoliensis]|uniref:ATP-binding protein n=1 Tax=Herbidospora mongoliensis TaxID=688067 RepID=UPI0008325C5A|nr:LuxR family transcriptional regulator [Herbidospora mongoliensis]
MRSMVGRTAELATVRGMVDGVRRGRGGVLLISGESGIGKTRLLREAADQARKAGLAVASGRAVEGGATYRPLAEALGKWHEAWPGCPEPVVNPAVDPALVICGEVLKLLRAGGGERGCLLVLDDLHWADGDTLAVLDYLTGAFLDEPILVVASVCDDEAVPGVLTRMMRRDEVTTLRLGRLTAAEVAGLAADLPETARRFVVEHADGLPYLAEELVASLREGGPSVVPGSLVCRVAGHLAALTPERRAVLEAAAVLGTDPDWTILSPMTGTPEAQVLGALRDSVPHLLVQTGGGLRWRHTLTREAVLAPVTQPERASLARRAAEVILTRGEPGREAYAAELLAAAGEDLRSAEIFLRLARRDMNAAALHSAEDHLDRASALGPRVAVERVRLLTLLGAAPAALEAGAPALAEVTGDQHAELCLRLAEAALAARRWAEADRYIERAGRPDDPRALVLAADSAFGAGDLRRAEGLAVTAADRAEQQERWETVCQALIILGRCATRDDLSVSRRAFARAAQIGAEHGLVPDRVTALLGLGMLDLLDDAASPALVEGREVAQRAGLHAEVAWSEVLLAEITLNTRGPKAAAVFARSAAEQAGRLRLANLESLADLFLATDHAVTGDAAAMRAVLARALARPHARVEIPAVAQATLGIHRLLSRDLPGARDLLDDAIGVLAGHDEACLVQHWGLWALLRTVLGDRDAEARAALRRSPAMAQVANRAGLQYADAVAAGRAGQPGLADALFADADRALAGHHWWRRVLRLLVLEAAVADGWGDPVAALRVDLDAHVQADDHQMARVCRDLLRAAGAPTRRGRGLAPVPPGLRAAGVTSREMDVLGLVAQGLTNGKIAERLVISRRTVDTHVASLLAKTASADRSELRALASAG